MKNRLVSDEQRIEYKHIEGHDFSERRKSGRTLGIAFSTIGSAMEKPGEPISVVDHYGGTTIHESDRADENLMRMILGIINTLNLKCFRIERPDYHTYHLVYDVFEKEDIREKEEHKPKKKSL
jgi:hypothetical protein